MVLLLVINLNIKNGEEYHMSSNIKIPKDYIMVSHEIKTPLAIIKNNGQLIRRFCKTNKVNLDKFLGFSTNIIAQCDILTKIINNLIDLSFYNGCIDCKKINSRNNIENMRQNLQIGVVDILNLCQELTNQAKQYFCELQELESNLNEIDIKFHNKSGDKSIYIECDRVKIERIITNLISNALKYNQKWVKKVEITLQQTEELVIIKVKDNGNGVSSENFNSIFEPFVRLETKKNYSIGGCGIGLSIVKLFTQIHNGEVDLISNINKGSEFIIKIPKVQNINKDSHNIFVKEEGFNIFEQQFLNIEFSDIYN